MICFDGIIYRIWGVCGCIFLIGVLCILIEKPWKNQFTLERFGLGIFIIGIAFSLGIFYLSRIISPSINYFDGMFVSENRNSTIAPPLPLTYEYIFSTQEEKDPVVYIDVISKKNVFPEKFVEGNHYRIYFDELTRIIVHVESLSLEHC